MREHQILEIDAWFPALVLVGEERPMSANNAQPPWLLSFQHQYGGHACLHAELAGIVVPLTVIPSAAPLLKGFDALGCGSPHERKIREHEHLSPLHLTLGDAYDSEQIACLQAFLEQAPDFPLRKPYLGHEAMIELDHSPDDLLRLVGLPVLGPELLPEALLTDEYAEHYVDGPFGVHKGATLTRELLERLGPLDGVRALLLWANSD